MTFSLHDVSAFATIFFLGVAIYLHREKIKVLWHVRPAFLLGILLGLVGMIWLFDWALSSFWPNFKAWVIIRPLLYGYGCGIMIRIFARFAMRVSAALRPLSKKQRL